ncbi:MAG: hypothetical protein AB7G37_03430 [Solirubrobacteraceae bacterium]
MALDSAKQTLPSDPKRMTPNAPTAISGTGVVPRVQPFAGAGQDPAALLAQWGVTLPENDTIAEMILHGGNQPIIASRSGGIYTDPNAPAGTFLGSWHSPSMQGAHNDPDRYFTGLRETPNGGYQLVSNNDERYDFNPDGGQLAAPAAPAPALGTGSPEYEALARALDLEQSTAEGNAASERAEISRRGAFFSPEIERQGTIARRGIEQSAISRNMWGGGSMAQRLTDQRAAQQVQQGQVAMQEAEGVGKVERELATKTSDIGRRRAESALTAAGQRYLRDSLTPYTTPAAG